MYETGENVLQGTYKYLVVRDGALFRTLVAFRQTYTLAVYMWFENSGKTQATPVTREGQDETQLNYLYFNVTTSALQSPASDHSSSTCAADQLIFISLGRWHYYIQLRPAPTIVVGSKCALFEART